MLAWLADICLALPVFSGRVKAAQICCIWAALRLAFTCSLRSMDLMILRLGWQMMLQVTLVDRQSITSIRHVATACLDQL